MMAWWSKQAHRIDAMSLRERVFVFVGILVVCLYGLDSLWLSPVQKSLLLAEKQTTLQLAELQKLRSEHAEILDDKNSLGATQTQLVKLEAALKDINARIAATSAQDQNSANLPSVLVHFLKRQQGLTLVRTATLVPEQSTTQSSGGMLSNLAQVITQQTSGENAKANAEAQALQKPQVLELTVAGPYLELVRYVQSLEAALPALRWSSMRMVSEKQPPELTLQVSMSRGHAQ